MTALRTVGGARVARAKAAPEAAARGASARPRARGVAAPRRVARLAVLGASGYSGQELVRLALAHPGLETTVLLSREHAGKPAAALLPGLDPRAGTLPIVADPAELTALLERDAFDTLIACLPHGAFAALLANQPALAKAARIVDLSSDFRGAPAPAGPAATARGAAPSVNGAAPSATGSGAPAGSPFVYGLPEAFRADLAHASRIANPGCYPTAAALALLPALEAGWIQGPVMVSALSGVSGAGRASTLRTSFVELDGGAALYRAGTVHAHVPEMARTFARLAGSPIDIGFAPQLVPMARGILLTATAALAAPLAPEAARAHYLARYAGEPFVRVLDADCWPETRAVRASNRCDVAVTTLHGGRTLLATAALDNLVKGAAGQAIQNLNLMLGWPEDTGLPRNGSPW